ncbi:MAG: response regulator transcription factor [Stackebrandtia sp.]
MTADESIDRLVGGVRRLARGIAVVDAVMAASALTPVDNPLTDRETQVLSLTATGASTREIADMLSLRVGTVRNYLSSVAAKTGARSRLDAVRIAQESGWI